MRLLAEYIMRGRTQATGIAGLCGVLSWVFPPLSYLSGATVALVTLRLGAREGLIVVLGTAALASVVALVWIKNTVPALALISAIWLPAWVCAQILRTTRSQGAMLVTIGILGGLFVVGMWAVMDDPQLWWREWLGKILEHTQIQDGSGLSAEIVDHAALVMNGLMAAAISLSLAITLLIARWWQAILYNPGGFGIEFQELRLPRVLGIPVAIAAVWVVIQQAKGIGYAIITDLVLVASVLYFFQGLAVIHYRVRHQSTRWVMILYALLFLIPHYTYLSLAMTGLADSFVNFRALDYSDSST